MKFTPTILWINRIIVITCWLAALALGLIKASWLLLIAILILHSLEWILVGLKRGRAAGYALWFTFLATISLGYAWWLFLENKHDHPALESHQP